MENEHWLERLKKAVDELVPDGTQFLFFAPASRGGYDVFSNIPMDERAEHLTELERLTKLTSPSGIERRVLALEASRFYLEGDIAALERFAFRAAEVLAEAAGMDGVSFVNSTLLETGWSKAYSPSGEVEPSPDVDTTTGE